MGQIMKLTSTLSKQKRNRLIFYCILLAYPILQFCVFYLGVNGNSILLAFKSYSYDNGTYDFVGFDNFISLFEYLRVQPEMKTMFLNSASAYFVSTIVGISLGVLFSYYIYKKFVCHGLFKVLLFLPQILSTLVLAVIFQFIANRALPSIAEQWFSFELDGLLKNGTETVFPTLLFFSVWAGLGTHVIMFVGAMGNISDSIIESAQIDGTTAFTEFIYIIFPMIYPTFVTFMVVQIAHFFTNQLNLYSFFSRDADINDRTIGYYMFIEANQASMGGYPRLACLGLLCTAIAIPTTFLLKWCLNKVGPSMEA